MSRRYKICGPTSSGNFFVSYHVWGPFWKKSIMDGWYYPRQYDSFATAEIYLKTQRKQDAVIDEAVADAKIKKAQRRKDYKCQEIK